jgi:hypothetical protein
MKRLARLFLDLPMVMVLIAILPLYAVVAITRAGVMAYRRLELWAVYSNDAAAMDRARWKRGRIS